jgi:Holliday junction DNA helicase RuvA
VRAIASGDAKRFQAAPGVGKRTAQRLIVELRERVAGELAEAAQPEAEPQGDARLLAREGLVGLGYSVLEAERLLDGESDGTPEEMIQRALRRAAEASGAR